MARPVKGRNVCSLPLNNRFGPLGLDEVDQENIIKMSVDQYETIRLIDLEGFTQAECAEQMDIARTTVQGIYSKARFKLAKSLVENKVIVIKGGNYRLCDGHGGGCGRGCLREKSNMGNGNQRRGKGFQKNTFK